MKSVSICGSKRYKDEIAALTKKLESAGVTVFDPNFKEPLPENIDLGSDNLKKIVFKGLTLEHFDWIRKADVCFVYNKKNYCGVSVSLEMGYATALGKPVFALTTETGDPCRDALIDKVAATPKELIELLS